MGIAEVLMSGIGAVTLVTLAALRVARVSLAAHEDRCPEICGVNGGLVTSARCDLRKDHAGPHHLPETSRYYEHWWQSGEESDGKG